MFQYCKTIFQIKDLPSGIRFRRTNGWTRSFSFYNLYVLLNKVGPVVDKCFWWLCPKLDEKVEYFCWNIPTEVASTFHLPVYKYVMWHCFHSLFYGTHNRSGEKWVSGLIHTGPINDDSLKYPNRCLHWIRDSDFSYGRTIQQVLI